MRWFIIDKIELYILNNQNKFQSLKEYRNNILNNLYNIYNSNDIIKISNFGYSYLDGEKYIFYHPIFIFKSKYKNNQDIKTDNKFKKEYKMMLSFIFNDKSNEFYDYCMFSGNTFLFFTKFIILFKYFDNIDIVNNFKLKISKVVYRYFNHQLNKKFIDKHLLITNKNFTYLGFSRITKRDIYPVSLNILRDRSIDNLLKYTKIKNILKPKQLREFILNNFYDIKIFVKFGDNKNDI